MNAERAGTADSAGQETRVERTSKHRGTVQSEIDEETDSGRVQRDLGTWYIQKTRRIADISVWYVFRTERRRK